MGITLTRAVEILSWNLRIRLWRISLLRLPRGLGLLILSRFVSTPSPHLMNGLMVDSEIYTSLVPRGRIQTHRCVLEGESGTDNRETVPSRPSTDGARHISRLILIQAARRSARPPTHPEGGASHKVLHGVSVRWWCRYSMPTLE